MPLGIGQQIGGGLKHVRSHPHRSRLFYHSRAAVASHAFSGLRITVFRPHFESTTMFTGPSPTELIVIIAPKIPRSTVAPNPCTFSHTCS